MIVVVILGIALILFGGYLIVANATNGEDGSAQLPGISFDIPASLLVLFAGIVLFAWPFSPWWPDGDDAADSTIAAPATTAVALTAAPDTAAATTTAAPTTTIDATTTTAEATTTTTTTTLPPLPAFVTTDCIPYNGDALEVEIFSDRGWRLIAGNSALLLYDTEAEAQRGLAIAQNHTELCFIGRSNTQADRIRYVHEFWNGDSGANVPIPGSEDCLPYDPAALSIEDLGSNVWRLRSASTAMAVYDGEDDATKALALAGAHSQQCFMGRSTSRTDRDTYIREYWK